MGMDGVVKYCSLDGDCTFYTITPYDNACPKHHEFNLSYFTSNFFESKTFFIQIYNIMLWKWFFFVSDESNIKLYLTSFLLK